MDVGQGLASGWAKVDFDADGPLIGYLRLLKKGAFGFSPPTSDEFISMFSAGGSPGIDVDRTVAALAGIAKAMNEGDMGLAAVAASRLRFPAPTREKEPAVVDPIDVSKAGTDDPKHPGYPAGEPGGKGGQFRPKEQAPGADAKERTERLKRLANRKTFRSIARRVLSTKRVLKMIGKYVEAEIVQDVPFVNDIVGASSMADDLELMANIAQDTAESDAAIAFVNKGPVDLKDLQMSPTSPQSFRSFDEFKKIEIEIEKQFGPAGDGYDYHHIVEQGPNTGAFTQEQLQSTDNIVRIPRLLHEEINSVFGTSQSIGSEFTTPRAYLRGRSFEEQREYGIGQLRKIGIIH